MPYNPGVTDRSGEILLQGVLHGASSLAQGLAQAGQEYQRNKAANNAAQASFSASLAKNPQLLKGADEKTLKLIEKFKSGETGLKDNTYLAGWAATAQQQEQENMQRQIMNMKIQQEQRQAQAAQRLQQLGQFQSGVGSGVYSPAAQSVMRGQLQDPATQFAARTQSLTGQTPSPEVMQRMAEFQATPPKQLPMFDPFNVHTTDAKGNPMIRTMDKMTGKTISEGPTQRMVRTPEEEARAAGLAESARFEATSTGKFLEDVSTQAELARERLMDANNTLSLFDQGASSGFGQEYINAVQNAFARFNKDQGKITNNQELEQALAKMTLNLGKQVMSGSGSVSNYEREAIKQASANINLTPATNKRILALAKAADERRIAIEDKRIELEDAGLSPAEIAKELRKYRAGLIKQADEQYTREDELQKIYEQQQKRRKK